MPSIVACPGTRWCSRGLVNTGALADAILSHAGDWLSGKTVCISGCPNGCAHSRSAQIGMVGAIATVEGERREVFDLYAGGEMGRGAKLADLVERKLSVEHVLGRLK